MVIFRYVLRKLGSDEVRVEFAWMPANACQLEWIDEGDVEWHRTEIPDSSASG